MVYLQYASTFLFMRLERMAETLLRIAYTYTNVQRTEAQKRKKQIPLVCILAKVYEVRMEYTKPWTRKSFP